jgi:aminoglycoside 3-N-acetyltransferase
MSEAEAIDRVESPAMTTTLQGDLVALGVAGGEPLLVHPSSHALTWVCGGAPAIIDRLQSVLTTSWTLVMPTHSTQYSDWAQCTDPPVTDEWRPIIRAERPPYRPAVTPTRGLGAVPACYWGHPSVIRS